MAQAAEVQHDRRRANRIALHLAATLREGSRKAQARVIDISTHGCRVECPTVLADGTQVWLGIDGLQNQQCRVAWHCEEFVGLEFLTPLSEPVFERLVQEHQLTDKTLRDLRGIASRTSWLARKAADDDVANLAELSRKCAEDAVVEGLRRGQAPKKA
jgi:hypothetical protein